VLQGIEAVLATEGRLPVNVKLLFDGEEEAGSPGMDAFVRDHADMLDADVITIIDILKYRSDMPAIYYGSKGLLSVAIDVSGPTLSVHSGIYGGDITNPADVLVRILNSLKDRYGKIMIPGFYDRVRDITPEEKADFASLPFDRGGIKAMLGVEPVAQEKGYTPIECIMARPTLSINGLWGGALSGAPLMIIPASAGALISIRLVPDQSAGEIYRMFKAYVDSMTPPGIKITLHVETCSEPYLTPRDSIAVKVAGRALEYAFGSPPVLVRSGGTSAIVSKLKKATGVDDIVVTGWGNPGDGEHAPNEHFSLENYRRGIIATADLLYELSVMSGNRVRGRAASAGTQARPVP
jgi:acetylornithine deacetylase/succinyl-diaminopimelate desuccinylase-like protein